MAGLDDSTEWLKLLSFGRRKSVEDKITTAKRKTGYSEHSTTEGRAMPQASSRNIKGPGRSLNHAFQAAHTTRRDNPLYIRAALARHLSGVRAIATHSKGVTLEPCFA